MDIADWTATVVVVWVTFIVALVALSVVVALIIGRVLKFRDQQVPAMSPGKTAGPVLGKRTTVWRSTVAADGHVHHRQLAQARVAPPGALRLGELREEQVEPYAPSRYAAPGAADRKDNPPPRRA